MNEALLVSNILLWMLVVALGAIVVALTRQVGLLHERIAPVGALAVEKGPRVGEAAPVLELTDLDGEPIRVGGADESGRRTLLFFLSPTCPVCETLLPTLRRLVRDEGDVRLVYASDGDPSEHEGFRASKGLLDSEYLLSRDLGLRYEVSKLPFAVLINAEGVVRAKGMVNTREHVESLFRAEELDVASLQDYLERERGNELAVVAEQGGRR
ncbi:MAG: methylamine dehydrogenase accessory protein MauD [Deltaproteobacteria bacterium]|nr:methylamine dehydrogenase accessory protein MauD [Deltaproteobacteria bacterium]